MTQNTSIQFTLFPMSKRHVRAYSHRNVAGTALNPQAYKIPNEPMVAEIVLDFKVWGKSPRLGCYFPDGGKILLFAQRMPMTAAIRP